MPGSPIRKVALDIDTCEHSEKVTMNKKDLFFYFAIVHILSGNNRDEYITYEHILFVYHENHL